MDFRALAQLYYAEIGAVFMTMAIKIVEQ